MSAQRQDKSTNNADAGNGARDSRARIPGTEGPGLAVIDTLAAYAAASRRLIGKPVVERAPWNTVASADAIRHFAWGIGDDNPLWVDLAYAAEGPFGRLAAPPAFLFSVLYPVLHGVPPGFSPTFLISDLDCRWYLPTLEGDEITATSVHKEVIETFDREGRDVVYVVSETTYHNLADQVVGTIEATLAVIGRADGDMLLDREIHAYSGAELDAVAAALASEQRTGADHLSGIAVKPGDELPAIVRGPLSIGDLICWQAAIGPSYRAGGLAYRDLADNPHTATSIPGVGWPVRYSQQHEDFSLSRQRGMPAPFDNSTMRAAWLSVLLTNWMGDSGVLRRLQVSTPRPVIYGDINWYSGHVTRKVEAGEETLLTIGLEGANQLGEITTTGVAEVALPSVPRRPKTRDAHARPAIMAGARYGETARADVFQLFDLAVQARPEAVALHAGDRPLTYRALSSRVNRLAHALMSEGVGPGSKPGLWLDRSADSAVLLLACARVGAASIPLDTSYPPARIARMLLDAGADVLITADGNVPDCPGSDTALSLEVLLARSARYLDEAPAVPARLGDPLHVLFTSGSTDDSKAVAISRGSLGQYVSTLIDDLGVGCEDVCLHSASFSFSAATRQFWLPLCAGATLVIADDESRSRPLRLFEVIRERRITVWDTVPSVLQFAVESLAAADSSIRAQLLDNRLRQVRVTGEPLAWETVRGWQSLAADQPAVVNLYSQTETGGTVCAYDVARDTDSVRGIVPLGRPLADSCVGVFDEDSYPAPVGVAGEIVVASERLAIAYVAGPEANSDRFVTAALDGHDNVRFFRTGDLGRLRPDGILECLGRLDDQVKIRGLRIRLGEVESVLRRDDAIEDCVVVIASDPQNTHERHLVAYVVPAATNRAIESSELRRRLAVSLPAYMVPGRFVPIHSTPKNPNGKLDRLALPPVALAAIDSKAARVAPRNATEEMLERIWCGILNAEKLDIHDSFFALGGHSLLATRVMTQVGEACGVELSLLDFFADPTIAGLASLIDNHLA